MAARRRKKSARSKRRQAREARARSHQATEKTERTLSLQVVAVGRPADSGRCVYCCTRDATTRDHVPPKALLKGTPAPRITVPSCATCNCDESGEDEYLRLTLSADIGAHSHPAADRAWETAFRGLQRPPAAGFKGAFYKTIRYMNVVGGKGEHLGRVLTYEASGPRQGRVIARVIRGLYYHETGHVLPDHHVLAWPFNFLAQKELGERVTYDLALRMANFARTNPAMVLGDGVLQYWCHPLGSYLAWWLVFFGGMPFFGLVFPKRPGQQLHPAVRVFEFPAD